MQYSWDRYYNRFKKMEALAPTSVVPVAGAKGHKNIKSQLKDMINNEKADKEENIELLDTSEKVRATQIIKKIFLKNCNLENLPKKDSLLFRSTIKAVKHHQATKNSAVCTVIETQIEKSPERLNEELAQLNDRVIKATRNAARNHFGHLNPHAHRKMSFKSPSMSVRSVSSTETQVDINFVFKMKIKQNLQTKKQKMRLVLLLFVLSLLFFLASNVIFRVSLDDDELLQIG